MSVATASPAELVAFSVFLLILATGAWLFSTFWGRMWTESFQSRSVGRRFLRWQRFAFRGHYPLGHWNKPGHLGRVQAFVYVWRGIILLTLILWFWAVARRIMT